MISLFKNRRVKAQVRAHERAHAISQARAAHPTSKTAMSNDQVSSTSDTRSEQAAEHAAIAAVLAKPGEPLVF